MPFTLPDLPYAYDALEPTIDARTMEIHHSSTIRPTWTTRTRPSKERNRADSSVESVIASLAAMPDAIQAAVRNNAADHANHSLFWTIMSTDGGGEPEGELKAAIDDLWGSTEELKKVVNDGGVKRFGSGWTWLVYDGTGLAVKSTPNQDSPLWTATSRFSASTCGSTPTTSTTRTVAPTTWRPGGTSSTGQRSAAASSCRQAFVGDEGAHHRRHRQARRPGCGAPAERRVAGDRGSRDGDLSRADDARRSSSGRQRSSGAWTSSSTPHRRDSSRSGRGRVGGGRGRCPWRNGQGSFFVTQAAAPHLRESGGLVVMVEDVAAYQPWPSFAAHCAAKAAQAMLTRVLARALAPEVPSLRRRPGHGRS